MQALNLPSFDFDIRGEGEGATIFDSIRKKHLVLTPEEWVRQHFIRFLIDIKKFPAGRCAIEKEIRLRDLRRRPDLVVYDDYISPLLIAEFKAPSVKIDHETLFQAAMYNNKLQVPYLILSNGLQHYCLFLRSASGKPEYLEDIPLYSDLHTGW